MSSEDSSALAPFIDHTLLKADATRTQILTLCQQALQHRFFSVCVNSVWVEVAAAALAQSSVKVVAVVGFPLGASLSSVKAFEAQEATRLGASEIDMVLNVGALKDGNDAAVGADIRAVVEAVRPWPVKVILETALLSDEEKIRACLLAKEAGTAFVKTSTGFSTGGATVHDVELLRKTVGPDIGVKASGGIRTSQDAWAMVRAGANRLGVSASVAIVQGEIGQASY